MVGWKSNGSQAFVIFGNCSDYNSWVAVLFLVFVLCPMLGRSTYGDLAYIHPKPQGTLVQFLEVFIWVGSSFLVLSSAKSIHPRFSTLISGTPNQQNHVFSLNFSCLCVAILWQPLFVYLFSRVKVKPIAKCLKIIVFYFVQLLVLKLFPQEGKIIFATLVPKQSFLVSLEEYLQRNEH